MIAVPCRSKSILFDVRSHYHNWKFSSHEQESLSSNSIRFYSTYTKRRSASETATEFALSSFNRSEATYKSQRIKLLDVIAACNQLNVNDLN